MRWNKSTASICQRPHQTEQQRNRMERQKKMCSWEEKYYIEKKSKRGRVRVSKWVSEWMCVYVFREIRSFRTCLLQRHIWIYKMLLYRSQRTYSAPVTIWQICCSLCHHNLHTCKMNSLLHHIKSFHSKLYGSNFMHICTLPHVTHSHQGLWVSCSFTHLFSFPFLIFAPIQHWFHVLISE